MKQSLLRLIFILNFLFFIYNSSHAQFAFIPDTNFRNFLMNNGFAGCMVGNTLDTTCPAVVNATQIFCGSNNIQDITGISYFDNLTDLNCPYNQISFLPRLPASLLVLECGYNLITFLPDLPPDLFSLSCSNNQLTYIPNLPLGLQNLNFEGNSVSVMPILPDTLYSLNCTGNPISFIPSFPSNLHTLRCGDSLLTSLPPFDSALLIFSCYGTSITSLPALPPNLKSLYVGGNYLMTSLPALPSSLQSFTCYNQPTNSLPALPSSLKSLQCNYTPITSLPVLPQGDTMVWCQYNQLTSLPILPLSLKRLECQNNFLTSLPALPDSLTLLHCGDNQITVLPTIPSQLETIYCQNNFLTAMPSLPSRMLTLYCPYNQITTFNNFPDSVFGTLEIGHNPIACLPQVGFINHLQWANTNIQCLPNIPTIISAAPLLDGIPLCLPGNGCPTFWNISGNVFWDINANCSLDTNENSLKNIPVMLDSGGTNLQSFFTDQSGRYSFHTGLGNYSISVDTANLPFDVDCPIVFFNSSSLTSVDSLDSLLNFGLICKNGFDLAALSISPSYMFRIGNQQQLFLNCGDMAGFYGGICTNGISGSVQVILDSLATYFSPAPSALIPSSVNGDTVTWNINDFGVINPQSDFNLIVDVTPFATINDTICIEVTIFPLAGDNITFNNSLTECFPVTNSYDPNQKFMHPSGEVDTTTHWFTFTVFFQNTGTAAAENIYILDTLNENLDPLSFTYISSSHEVITQLLPGNILRFNYPNINLADSNSNEPSSHGFVKYKVKRKDSMQLNETITNTAHIYFDYNSSVTTNTVSATLSLNVGFNSVSQDVVKIYPNPAQSQLIVNSKQYAINSIEVRDLLGQVMYFLKTDGRKKVVINLSELTDGFYILNVNSENGQMVKKILKQ